MKFSDFLKEDIDLVEFAKIMKGLCKMDKTGNAYTFVEFLK